MPHERCQCCWTRTGRGYLIDNHYETILCLTCARELRTQQSVKAA
jgi:hypothetical protein